VTNERSTELWDKDRTSVIQYRIETLKDCLWGKVHFVEQNPMTFLQSFEELRIFPSKFSGLTTIDRKIGSKQVNEVSLIREIDSMQCMPTELGQSCDKTCLADAGASLQQDCLW